MDDYRLPELHPDLKPYLQGDELHHPLLEIDGGAYPALYQRINQIYEYKQRQLVNPEPLNEWLDYLPDIPQPDRIIEFIKNELGRQDPEYFRILGQMWTSPELIGGVSCTLEMMLYLESVEDERDFPPNILHLMTDTERQKLAELPEEFTVYRGHDPRLLNGFSWTIDRQIALQYAYGLCAPRCISTGTVSKNSVVAYIDRWNESEILVSTRFVREIDTQAVS